MSKYWKGKVAIATGASVGIGAKIAVKLADNGIHVAGFARRTELIDKLNEEVKGEGKIYSHFCDLTDESTILEAFSWARKKFSVISILICNAGMIKANFITESTIREFRDLYELNILGTTICLREGLQLIRSGPSPARGHIIVMNSILGHRIPDVPVPLFSVYPATKHAITALCQTVRQEIHFLKLNIKMTSINPGMVDTDMLSVYSHSVANLPKLTAEDVAETVFFALDTPNHMQVEDITVQAMRRHGEEQ